MQTNFDPGEVVFVQNGSEAKRWRFRRKMILCEDGKKYLKRWEISTPWFGVYVHRFFLGDIHYAPHDHPWNFWSFLLRGEYVEVSWDRAPIGPPNVTHNRGFLNVIKRKAVQAHYVSLPLGVESAWTLVVRGKFRRHWGFYPNYGAWVPFGEFRRSLQEKWARESREGDSCAK